MANIIVNNGVKDFKAFFGQQDYINDRNNLFKLPKGKKIEYKYNYN